MKDNDKPTLAELQAAQLREYPDSVFMTVSQVLQLATDISASGKQSAPWRWLALTLSNLETGPLQFYLCGKQENGTYRWMGARFGVKGSEYLSGCPRYYSRPPQ